MGWGDGGEVVGILALLRVVSARPPTPSRGSPSPPIPEAVWVQAPWSPHVPGGGCMARGGHMAHPIPREPWWPPPGTLPYL